jgi:hypothetical protein
MVEEHKDETGLYGRIGPTTAINEGEDIKLQDFLSNRVENLLEDKSILDQIESDITRVTDSKANDIAKNKNLKSKV